ncbi:trafficking protein particle complex subunit 12 [Anaeramoeba ignava]|uniref:Trafficking protein particle complex subunit 12 n=1 Tax=Anaeramoeba ignava TaxID=1746090 RepID=A0A9Q0L7C5_ANAIG|nr:trafficking protein particle complex subunit 12 [Anaeramoeba ignava]
MQYLTQEKALSLFFDPTIPPQRATFTRMDEVEKSLEGLKLLANENNWKGVVHLTLILSETYKDDLEISLQIKLIQIIGLIKLELYSRAQDSLQKLGNLNSKQYFYETYPAKFPNRKGSFVPFTLRVLQAEFPYFQGDYDKALENLYTLHSNCIQEIGEIKKKIEDFGGKYPETITEINSPNSLYDQNFMIQNNFETKSNYSIEDIIELTINTVGNVDDLETAKESLSLLEKRSSMILFKIINIHIFQNDFELALNHLNNLYLKFPSDHFLSSTIGRIYLKLGDIESAKKAFEFVEKITGATSIFSKSNSGLVQIALGNYRQARDIFQEIYDNDPNNISALNNLALMHFYTCNLEKAIFTLETFIRKDPVQNLQKVIVNNLSGLYDLGCDNSEEKKKVLSLVYDSYKL